MCIFSQEVYSVSKTNIFGRIEQNEIFTQQYLAYSMDFSAAGELAMILPIPVLSSSNTEEAIQFFDFSNYPNFFEDLDKPFRRVNRSMSKSMFVSDSLKVHNVGDFLASYVPRIRDFERLDEKFRLSNEVWRSLPQYGDYGFVVFKLNVEKIKDKERFGLPGLVVPENMQRIVNMVSPDNKRVHPMVFSFPTREPDAVYFPTVHVHDGGSVPKVAHFDHALYLQSDLGRIEGFERSINDVSSYVNIHKSYPVVGANSSSLFKATLKGNYENKDTFIKMR